MSPSILFPFVAVLAISLCHVSSVQSAVLPGIVASLMRRNSMGSAQWRANAAAGNRDERKSVTLEEKDDEADDAGQRLDRDYLEAAMRGVQARSPSSSSSSSFRGDLSSLLLKKSDDVESKRQDNLQDRDYFQAIGIAPSSQNKLQLKDRDYFEAIGIAPSGYGK